MNEAKLKTETVKFKNKLVAKHFIYLIIYWKINVNIKRVYMSMSKVN